MGQGSGHILVGVNREIRAVPNHAFVESTKRLPSRMAARLAFMSREHHLIRDFVVRELPRQERPLSPTHIAQVTALSLQRVSAIVTELESNLFFLVRDSEGNVSWAFPVTTSRTPHRLTFSTGEKSFGA
jgi:CRP-like cAMP-binding protein